MGNNQFTVDDTLQPPTGIHLDILDLSWYMDF